MRISYELYMKLKDAGFPYRWHLTEEFTQAQKDCNEEIDPEQSPFVPTLSELIEACGEDFFALKQTATMELKGTGEWMATAYSNRKGIHKPGKTPEEAVARLYLTLNQ